MEFWGRQKEIAQLRDWDQDKSRFSVVYGRRRIGKTRLIEEAFSKNRILKIEGLEGQSSKEQKSIFIESLVNFFNLKIDPHSINKNQSWRNLFKWLSELIGDTKTIVFFDELQWLAANKTSLVSDLKYCWDNFFKKENCIHLIVCGSISSFMVKKVIKSKALYGRIHFEINLQPLLLPEIQGVFKPERSHADITLIYMAVGGIPQYLEMIDKTKSSLLNLQQLCFRKNGYLVNEFERLFASHFGTNQHYINIVKYLAQNNWGERSTLEKACSLDSGGRISEYLENLEDAGFIEKYFSIDKVNAVRCSRYRISDQYLRFYFKFIKPNLSLIQRGDDSNSIQTYLPDKKFDAWKGLAFESFCLNHHHLISKHLGFSGVQYHVGSWFGGQNHEKAQIDMMFIRADRTILICEIIYQTKPIGKSIIPDVEKKLLFIQTRKMIL